LSKVKIQNLKLTGAINDNDYSFKKLKGKNLEPMEATIRLSTFLEKPNEVVNPPVEYNKLSDIFDTMTHYKRLANNKEFLPMNRYSDIIPYEDTRVKLSIPKGGKAEDGYINANYVDSPFA
jgi:protein tyrosine phosphatase